MKILNWRIYSNKRIGKIVHIISGVKEDQELAKELLLGTRRINTKYPKYKIMVSSTYLTLYEKKKPFVSWKYITEAGYTGEQTKQAGITAFKERAAKLREAHKKYTINL